MDFFEAQARAKQRSSRLVFLFALAVLGTIAAGYFAAVIFLSDSRSLWQPSLLGVVSLVTIAVIALASLVKWTQFRAGGSAVAESVGGRRVDPRTTDLAERRLLNVVEEMALASGVPMPGVFVLDEEPAINAFAAGLTTSDAVVAVTRGTLEKLNRDELQGVVGHEFSHILNGDMRLNLRLTALVFGILVIGLAGRGLLRSLTFARHRPRRSGKNSDNSLYVIVALGLALLIIGYVGYFFGRIIQAAISRQREFLADASAVQFTRNPAGLSGALKKIGGYALGSSISSNKSAAIGHFFFAQAFRSGFTGLWSTHPPLDERLRAIDPQFDGKYLAPPEVVDVSRESFVTAGLVPPKLSPSGTRNPELETPNAFSATSGTQNPKLKTQNLSVPPEAVLASVGIPALLADAHELLTSLPPRLLDAAHSPVEARALIYGLVLSSDDTLRQRQLALVENRGGTDSLSQLNELLPALGQLGPDQKLPLLQLALPSLKIVETSALETFFDTLDELVHADAHVSPFEFALQKLLLRELARSRAPSVHVAQIYSFQAVADEIAVVLSTLAYSAHRDTAAAFAAGASQLKLLESRLQLSASPPEPAALDHALNKLATASLPIKRRLLQAAAYVALADATVHVEEYELLRAIAAVLDLPIPPLAPPAS